MKKQTKSTVADIVLRDIKQGRLTMRPRMYFMLLSTVSSIAIATFALSLAYLMSIVFFWIRIQTADTMARGARANLNATLSNFPWWAFLLGAASLALAVWLIKRQGRMYRYKTSIIVVVFTAITLFAALLLSTSGIGGLHQSGHRSTHGQPGWYRNLK